MYLEDCNTFLFLHVFQENLNIIHRFIFTIKINEPSIIGLCNRKDYILLMHYTWRKKISFMYCDIFFFLLFFFSLFIFHVQCYVHMLSCFKNLSPS